MRTTPVVNGDSPPAEAQFLIGALGKGQSFADLRFAHQTSGAIPPFNGRGVRDLVAQFLKGVLDAFLTAMHIANFDLGQPLALPVFDHLHMRRRVRDALAYRRPPPLAPLTSWLIGTAKDFWKQGGIAGVPIGEQGDFVAVDQPGRPIAE